jgi:hypothetical protein
MTREAFEQLVDAWLAEPERTDLRAQIDAALRAEPQWATLLDEWQRFDQALRRGLSAPEGVDWERLKARILSAMEPDADAQDDLLDAALRALPTVDQQVHWSRFHARVMAAVTRSSVAWASRPPTASRPPHAAPRRRRYTRVIAGAATLLAAAAALLLAFLPGRAPRAAPAGVLRVHVGAPPPNGAGVAYVQIAGGPAAAAAQPERLFDIDPLPPITPSDETAGYY